VGIAKDEAAAATWFKRAAEAGNPIAQNRYARMLAIGAGVPQDRIEAAKWHLIAAKAGAKDDWLEDFIGRLSDGDRKKAADEAAHWPPGSVASPVAAQSLKHDGQAPKPVMTGPAPADELPPPGLKPPVEVAKPPPG